MPATFLKKETLTQVFSYEFCEISENNFSQGAPVAASVINFGNKWPYFRSYVKALKHEYIFSNYSQNLNNSETFWTCYTKSNFPILRFDTSQITLFSRECLLHHYGGQLWTAWKRQISEKEIRIWRCEVFGSI